MSYKYIFATNAAAIVIIIEADNEELPLQKSF